MNTITNISSLSDNFPMENTTLFNNKWQKSGIFSILFNNNMDLRNCEKPHVEPHLFPYVVSETLGNERVAKPEAYWVVEIGRNLQAKKTKTNNNNNTNNDCNNYVSYCYHDNYDNNHCIGNVVRVPSMYSFDSKVNRNNMNKSIFQTMLWFSRRTYKPFASAHRVGEAYGKEGYGDKAGLSITKPIQSVSEAFSRTRWANVLSLVKTCLKRTSGLFQPIMDMSSSYLGGKVGKNDLSGLNVCGLC